MKISIITATYNSASTVRDTLSCIASQDYDNIEHLVIDGLSNDNTLDIVREFQHVSKLVSEKDKGIYDAMNKGIMKSSGDIIGILNSDDFYVNEQVLSKVANLFKNEKIDAVYADLQYVRSTDTKAVSRHWTAGIFSKSKLFYGWMPPHPTFFVRRAVYDKVGLFNTSLKSSADYEMMLRVLLKFKMTVAYLPEVIVRMRDGGMSNASLKNRLRANREDREAWKLNGLKPYFFTVYLKPIRKIFQFI